MKDYKERVLEEAQELKAKLNLLSDTVFTVDGEFDALPKHEQFLLYEQLDAMQKYFNALEARLSLWDMLPEGWDAENTEAA